MWRYIFNAVRKLLFIHDRLERHERQITELRQELDDLASSVEELRHETRLRLDNERHEREKFCLRVENALLNFERRLSLPPARGRRRKRR